MSLIEILLIIVVLCVVFSVLRAFKVVILNAIVVGLLLVISIGAFRNPDDVVGLFGRVVDNAWPTVCNSIDKVNNSFFNLMNTIIGG